MNIYSESMGEYQAVLRANGKAYIGLGHTPQEARRRVKEAANIGTGSFVFDFLPNHLTITTERISAQRVS